MLLTIYNLPPNTGYQDIKSLLKSKCGLNEFILDNLSAHTQNSRKVTIGLPEEEDAAILVRKVNGLYLEGYHLSVEPVKKKVTNTNDNMYKNQIMSSFNMGNNMLPNEPAASTVPNNIPSLLQQPALQQPALQQPYYQQASFNMNSYQPGFAQNMQQNLHTPFSYSASNNQNVFANYGYPQQMASQSTSQLMSQPFNNYKQEAPLGFGQQSSSNVWLTNNNQNSSKNAPGNNFSQQRNSRWDNSDKNSSRSNRDPRSRDRDRERNTTRDSNSFGRDTSARGQTRMRQPPHTLLDSPDYSHNRNNQSGERDFRRDSRDHGRYDRYDRNDRNNRNRASPPKPGPLFNAPRRPSPWQPEIFGKHATKPSFPMNPPKVPRPSRTRDRGNPKPVVKQVFKEKTEPPAKRPCTEASSNLGVFEEKKGKVFKNSQEVPPHRYETWCSQLAASFAREIMNNPINKTDLEKPVVLNELKSVIRTRLAMLGGDKNTMRMNTMSALYRANYNVKSDKELFKNVTAKITKLRAFLKPVDADEETPSATEQPVVKKPAGVVKKDLEAPPPVKVSKPVPAAEGDGKLPRTIKYTEKKKLLFKDEEIILSQLDPSLGKAIDGELDEMCEQIVEEFNDEPEEKNKSIQEQIKTSALLTTLKHVIKVNLVKRLKNIQPIMMRIFITPKVISKGKLGPILEAHGITNLTKTKSSYIATCSSYDELDRLCTMKPLVVDGSTIALKPYHLAGKKEKVERDAIMKQRKAIADSFTNFAMKQLEKYENKEDTQENIELSDEGNEKSEDHGNEKSEENGNEKSEENGNDKNVADEEEKEAENEESPALICDPENNEKNNENAEESQSVDQDKTSDATGEQETAELAEEENDTVKDSNDQLDDKKTEESEDNREENESTNENIVTVTNENNVNMETENIKQETENISPSEENKQDDEPKEISAIKQELNKSLEMAEAVDGSVHGKGDLDQEMKSEDNLGGNDYDDIDMADLNEDDLEDW